MDTEATAWIWDEDDGTYYPVVPGPSIVVYAPENEDDESIVPAEAIEYNGKHYWGSATGWLSKDADDDNVNSWQNEPEPTLSLVIPPEVLGGAFITNQTTIQVSAEGGIGEITWEGKGLSATAGSLDFNGSGNTRALLFREDQASETRADKLKYQIIVRADPELVQDQDIIQDVQSILRQQYLDRTIQIPPRGSKWISSSALKVINQQEIIDNFAKLQAKYTAWVHSTKNDNKIDATLPIYSSGRTPRENAGITGAEHNSLHQYGYAYDLTPLKDLGGEPGKRDDADTLVSIWADSLGFTGEKGYTYKKT